MKIGFIGAGNMAGAIMRGMVTNSFHGCDILAYDTDSVKLNAVSNELGISMACSAEDVIEKVDAVVLAVKPQVFPSLLSSLSSKLHQYSPLVISIAAGKTLASIDEFLGTGLPIIRVMPNIAAKVGEGMAAFCPNQYTDEKQLSIVRLIFESVGDVIRLEEHLFSAFSAIAGCSPAFTLLYIDALAQAGVRYGIPKATALKIAAQSILGTTRLLQETGEHPRLLMDQVCSPGGTTIEGICALQQDGFDTAVLDAIRASYEKDKQL